MEELNIQKIKAGDEKALKSLFERLLPRIRHIVFRSFPHTDLIDVDEIAQSAIFTIYSNLQKYEPARGNFWQWCDVIARNLTHQRLHAAIKDCQVSDIDNLPSKSIPTFDSTEAIDSARLLKETISLFPEGERSILLLRLEGYSFEEISEILGASKESIRSRYYRTLSKVRKILLTSKEETGKEVEND